MSLAPIVLFVYNRPWHTEQTLNALMQNELASESVLYIYADGPKENSSKEELQKIEDTRQIIRKQTYCKETFIIESTTNKGLSNSVIDGVTTIVNKYGKIIVLEDDLVTATGFLKFMNTALKRYENEEKVMQIAGYFFPIKKIKKRNTSFFLPMATSWGWGTWKRAWHRFDPIATGYQELKNHPALAKKFDLNDSYPYSKMLFQQMEKHIIDSWAIRWWWIMFRENGITLFPDCSLINNIGYDSEGTHTKNPDPYILNKFDENYYIQNFPEQIIVSISGFNNVTDYLKSTNSNKGNTSKLIIRLKGIKKIIHSFTDKIRQGI